MTKGSYYLISNSQDFMELIKRKILGKIEDIVFCICSIMSFDEITEQMILIGLTPEEFLTDIYFDFMLKLGVPMKCLNNIIAYVTVRLTGGIPEDVPILSTVFDLTYDPRWSLVKLPKYISLKNSHLWRFTESIIRNVNNPNFPDIAIVNEFLTLMTYIDSKTAHCHAFVLIDKIEFDVTLEKSKRTAFIDVGQLIIEVSKFLLPAQNT